MEHAHGASTEHDAVAQMYETFVKEKATLLGYVQDMIDFAAKLQGISPSEIKSDRKPDATEEESKDEAAATDGETRIKTIRECCIITTRINSVVSRQGRCVKERQRENFLCPVSSF